MTTYIVQIKAFTPSPFWKHKVLAHIDKARIVKNDFDYRLNRCIPEYEFGYGSIRFTGTEEELSTLLKALHANEADVKELGVIDTSKTLAEIRVKKSPHYYYIRENYYSPSEEESPISWVDLCGLVGKPGVQKHEELIKYGRVLIWIDTEELKKLLTLH